MNRRYGFLRRRTKQFGMQIESAVPPRLQLLDWDAMRIRPCIVADAGHLPGNFHVGPIGFDREAVIGHLAGYDGLRELADDRQLQSGRQTRRPE
jgi:hypothetical protein